MQLIFGFHSFPFSFLVAAEDFFLFCRFLLTIASLFAVDFWISRLPLLFFSGGGKLIFISAAFLLTIASLFAADFWISRLPFLFFSGGGRLIFLSAAFLFAIASLFAADFWISLLPLDNPNHKIHRR